MKNRYCLPMLTLSIFDILACSNGSSFSGKGNKPNVPKPALPKPGNGDGVVHGGTAPENPSTAPKEITENFESKSEQSGKADVVWLIDNSGSMSEEAANARKNFATFLSSISAARDLKVALISQMGTTGTAMSFPEMFKGKENYFHLPQPVGSTDALTIAAKASCKTLLKQGKVTCAAPGLDGILTENKNNSALPYGTHDAVALNGSLLNFFREDARRIYVIVTDDNVTGVTEKNFMAFLKFETPPTFKPVVYAFRGMRSENKTGSCKVSNDGVAYNALAKETGGKVYSICDEDWSASFKDLSEGIIKVSASGFALKHPDIAEVVSVTLNGTLVEKQDYSVAGGKLVFKDGILTLEGQKIEIKYVYK